VIPRIVVGDLVYSDTAARYAADLIGDVARTLVQISGWLGDRARDDYDAECSALADELVVDMPALLAGADYCLWLRDHVRHEIAALCAADLRGAELMSADDPDSASLCRMAQEPVPDAPPCDPPARLVPLEQIVDRCRRCIPHDGPTPRSHVDVIVSGYARRLEWMRENLAEARTVLARNATQRTAALVSHLDALSCWLSPLEL